MGTHPKINAASASVPKTTTGEAEVVRLRQSIETQMRRRILEAIDFPGDFGLASPYACRCRSRANGAQELGVGHGPTVRGNDRRHLESRFRQESRELARRLRGPGERAREWRAEEVGYVHDSVLRDVGHQHLVDVRCLGQLEHDDRPVRLGKAPLECHRLDRSVRPGHHLEEDAVAFGRDKGRAGREHAAGR